MERIADSDRALELTVEARPYAAHEIVFIDSTLWGAEQLAQAARDNVEVVMLDPSRDGVQQISEVLAGREDIEAVHIVSHGAPGQLWLGGSDVNLGNLDQYRDQLQSWRASLAPGADLLIYGCEAAAGESGQRFAMELGQLTGADIGASDDFTGGSQDANWAMEFTWGQVETSVFGQTDLLSNYESRLITQDLAGSSGWTPVMYGTKMDPGGDMQASAASTDLVGDTIHPLLYMSYNDMGSASEVNDLISFRMRVASANSAGGFGAIGLLGFDVNLDGDVDLFVGVNDTPQGIFITMYDPGDGANISPSTTSITPYSTIAATAATYQFTAVSATTDPNWNANTDIDGGGRADQFASFTISFDSIKQALARPNVPGNPTGGITIDSGTPLRFVLMTMTNTNSINGDIGGIVGGNKSSLTWDQLGAFSPVVSASDSPPIITSGGGGDTASYVIAEAETLVTQLTAQDMDPGDTLRWEIAGGPMPASSPSTPPPGSSVLPVARVPPRRPMPTVTGATKSKSGCSTMPIPGPRRPRVVRIPRTSPSRCSDRPTPPGPRCIWAPGSARLTAPAALPPMPTCSSPSAKTSRRVAATFSSAMPPPAPLSRP